MTWSDEKSVFIHIMDSSTFHWIRIVWHNDPYTRKRELKWWCPPQFWAGSWSSWTVGNLDNIIYIYFLLCIIHYIQYMLLCCMCFCLHYNMLYYFIICYITLYLYITFMFVSKFVYIYILCICCLPQLGYRTGAPPCTSLRKFLSSSYRLRYRGHISRYFSVPSGCS